MTQTWSNHNCHLTTALAPPNLAGLKSIRENSVLFFACLPISLPATNSSRSPEAEVKIQRIPLIWPERRMKVGGAYFQSLLPEQREVSTKNRNRGTLKLGSRRKSEGRVFALENQEGNLRKGEMSSGKRKENPWEWRGTLQRSEETHSLFNQRGGILQEWRHTSGM